MAVEGAIIYFGGGMQLFNIGDRVRISGVQDDIFFENKIGTVKEIINFVIGVEFDDFREGHCCFRDCKPRRGWYIALNNPKILIQKQYEEDNQLLLNFG